MSIGLTISVQDGATPGLQKLLAGLSNAGRTRLHRMAGYRVQACVRDYLIGLANTRHATAQRLGATPTGFLGQAAEKVAKPSALSAGALSAVVSLSHPGMKRAFQDVTITPRTARCLTIPNVAEAYGNRYASVLRLYGVDSVRKPGKRVLPKRADGKRWYILVPSVNQKQDRTLLPSDNAVQAAALEGAADYVDRLREASKQ